MVQTVIKGGGNTGPKDQPAFCSGTIDDPDGTLGISVVAVVRP